MNRPLNVVLLVVDSLRAQSIAGREPGAPPTPFLASMAERTVSFARAYATECWTLPSHLSMFTGLLPSEHGAHFQSMGYVGASPTIAEVLGRAGYRTAAITRNSIFDGTMPGVLRGFDRLEQPMAELRVADAAFHSVVALAKPRVRRLIRESGYFHAGQKRNHHFLRQLVRMGMPADRLALGRALEWMEEGSAQADPYFLFLNLYDVHAPYSPTEESAIPHLKSLEGLADALSLPVVLPKVSSHAYLRDGFRISDRSRRMLRRRYHDAIALMDRKLEWFWGEASRTGLLDDTVVVLTSDHGEGFGEHGLYLHDASVYETHVHVPLFVHWPGCASGVCDDVVSLRGVFDLLRAAASGGEAIRGTLLDPGWRERNPVAQAQHFHYPHGNILPEYCRNLSAAITRRSKVVRRGKELFSIDLEDDPQEESLQCIPPGAVREQLAGGSAAVTQALDEILWEAA